MIKLIPKCQGGTSSSRWYDPLVQALSRSGETVSPELAHAVHVSGPEKTNEALKAAGAITAFGLTPGVFGAVSAAYPALGATANLGFGTWGATELLGSNGLTKTINHIKKGEWGQGALSGLGDALNLGMWKGAVKSLRGAANAMQRTYNPIKAAATLGAATKAGINVTKGAPKNTNQSTAPKTDQIDPELQEDELSYQSAIKALNEKHEMPEMTGEEIFAVIDDLSKSHKHANVQESLRRVLARRLGESGLTEKDVAQDLWMPESNVILDELATRGSKVANELTEQFSRDSSPLAGMYERYWIKNYLTGPEREQAVKYWEANGYPKQDYGMSADKMRKNVVNANIYVRNPEDPWIPEIEPADRKDKYTIRELAKMLKDFEHLKGRSYLTAPGSSSFTVIDGQVYTKPINDYVRVESPKYLVHELSHVSDNGGDWITDTPYNKAETALYNSLYYKLFGKLLKHTPLKDRIEFKEYLTEPTEVRARVLSLRHAMEQQGLNPNNPEDIIKMSQNPPTFEYQQLLWSHNYDKDFVHKLIQYAPSAAAAVGLNYNQNHETDTKGA